jgi:hypothetical protein
MSTPKVYDIKDMPVALRMRARMLGVESPSCDNCRDYDTYSTGWCSHFEEDPMRQCRRMNMQVCDHWQKKP